MYGTQQNKTILMANVLLHCTILNTFTFLTFGRSFHVRRVIEQLCSLSGKQIVMLVQICQSVNIPRS